MKKKPPAPAPSKAPTPPTKQGAPPKGDATPTAAPTAAPADTGREFSDTPATAPDTALEPIKPLKLDPTLLPPPVPGVPGMGPIDRFKLLTDPASLIDWSAMRKPFLTRGVSLVTSDSKMIEQNWIVSYNNLVVFGLSPAIAAKVANLGTPFAYDLSLSRDFPTVQEQSNKDFEKMLGPGKKLGQFTVPIITPDTLGWAVKQVFGKDLDFRF